jgi:hypothetical protein
MVVVLQGVVQDVGEHARKAIMLMTKFLDKFTVIYID